MSSSKNGRGGMDGQLGIKRFFKPLSSDNKTTDSAKRSKLDADLTNPEVTKTNEVSTPASENKFDERSTKSHSTPAKSVSKVLFENKALDNQELDDAADDKDFWAHLDYKFLYPPERKDIEGRKPGDPYYDDKTLYVPKHFLDSQTPAMRQWWIIKQRNMDALLFFKMGKFYELFNEDAVIAVNILDIAFMKGGGDKPAHAGFPEVSFDKYAKMLIDRGYKVLRIEQTETPAMMEARCKKTGQKTKFDKVVNREVCQAVSKGTQMMSVTDMIFHTYRNQYLLAICESILECGLSNQREYGVCFLDVTIGKVFLGQFSDDRNLSNLHTLLSHNPPVEILYERGGLSDLTLQVIKKTDAVKTILKQDKEFWPIKSALCHLKTKSIFINQCGDFYWPDYIKSLFQDADDCECLMQLYPKEDKELCLKSFGAIVYYLQSHMIAGQVLSCALFEEYVPPLQTTTDSKQTASNCPKPRMILDHVALKNLEIFENSVGGIQSTLFDAINHCETHFGQRLLQQWICSPLCDIEQINNRLNAVEVLANNNNQSLLNEINHMLKNVPDLERLLSRIKSQSFRSDADARAILFENDQYSKNKINSLLTLLHTFKRLQKTIISMQSSVEESGSETLKKLLTMTTERGIYPDYSETLAYFDEAFNHDEAKKTGKIIPGVGVDADYDTCRQKITDIELELEDYLEEQKNVLRCRALEYFGTGKNRFQLQVPENRCSSVPQQYRIETTRKGYKRYYTPKIDELLKELLIAEEERNKALDNIMASICGQFSKNFKVWAVAIECVAIVDVLQSLAKYARSLKTTGVDVCRPEFIEGTALVSYKEGRHPSLVKSKFDFIANDLELDQRLVMLSGANMGGKSTLMRQTGMMVILAQIGSFVPAKQFKAVPIDRIFSRLGANDRIMEGESTFYTELIETSVMINHATNRSLLLLDELGRGTSTFDGTAIAYSVAEEISQKIKCLCLFSTHYHSLVEEFKDDKNVRQAHMACKVESSDADDGLGGDPLKEDITFLYKVVEGAAMRSYGFNVAKLAGIDPAIISNAYAKALECESTYKSTINK